MFGQGSAQTPTVPGFGAVQGFGVPARPTAGQGFGSTQPAAPVNAFGATNAFCFGAASGGSAAWGSAVQPKV